MSITATGLESLLAPVEDACRLRVDKDGLVLRLGEYTERRCCALEVAVALAVGDRLLGTLPHPNDDVPSELAAGTTYRVSEGGSSIASLPLTITTHCSMFNNCAFCCALGDFVAGLNADDDVDVL